MTHFLSDTKDCMHMLLVDPVDPACALSIEEYLLDIDNGAVVFFMYVNRPSVIIGKNQNPWAEANVPWLLHNNIPLIRRISGGGTVWHDHGNLNYSFVGPREKIDKNKNLSFLAHGLSQFGLAPQITDRGDMLLNGKKFSGNALCHKNGKTLHHGTILVHADRHQLHMALNTDWNKSMEITHPGVASLRTSVCMLEEHIPGIRISQVIQGLSNSWIALTNSQEVPQDFYAVGAKKSYAEYAWNYGRSPEFRMRVNGVDLTVIEGFLPNGSDLNTYLGTEGFLTPHHTYTKAGGIHGPKIDAQHT